MLSNISGGVCAATVMSDHSSAGSAERAAACRMPAVHFASIRAKRQIASEITQVATNIATMMNPAVLMLKF